MAFYGRQEVLKQFLIGMSVHPRVLKGIAIPVPIIMADA
jgi:hypothetical protein